MTGETASLRRSIGWAAIAFGVVLAVVIGVRLEQAALTVVVGVACGVGASIPTSLIVVSLLQRKTEKREKRQSMAQHQPPVVVVTPPSLPQLRQMGAWLDAEQNTLPMPRRREFAVIGEEETIDL